MSENSVVQPQRLARRDGTTVAPGDVVAFDARRGPLFRLVLKNMILTVLTLGIYRFWAKTAVRRWFWRHISISGERLEYTGKGSELFVGFLIAICILLPFFAVTSILEQVARTSVAGAIASQAIYLTGLFLLIQAAIFRMRRYRLTRTMWRGIRCGLDGKTWGYVKTAAGYWLLVIVTLGFAYPWMRVALSRHLMTRTRFGTQSFGFEANARQLVAVWLPAGLFGLVIVVLVVYGSVAVTLQVTTGSPEPETAAGYAYLVAIGLLLVQVPLYVRYRVHEFRHFAATTSLGEVRFESRLRTMAVVWLYLSAMILVAALLFVFGVVVALHAGQSVGPGDSVSPAFYFAMFLIFLGFIVIAGPIISLVIVQFGLARAVAGSLVVHNLPAVEAVIQSTEARPGHGEGLADALDLGDF